MKQINRRVFLKGIGALGGSALGLRALSLFATEARRQVLRYGFGATDIRMLDPMAGPNQYDKSVLVNIYEGLVRPMPGQADAEHLESDLAESWESSKDLRTWTFRLRKGVEFHGGYGEFTAEDVVFSIDRAKNKKTSVFYESYSIFKDIKGLDKYTVRMTLETPKTDLLFLPRLIGWQAGMIMSKKATEKLGDKAKTNPVGTGPFMFKEHIPQQRLVLVRNSNYYQGIPKIEQIIYRFLPDASSRILAFKAGELDIMEVDREQRAIDQVKGPGVVVESFGPDTVMMLLMDRSRKPLNDLRVRQAIAYAINRDGMVKFIGPDVAHPIYSVIPPGFVGGLQDLPEGLRYNHNPKKARELLAEAGLAAGFTLGPVYISEARYLRAPMELIQNQLSQVGIKIDLNVIAHPTFHQKNEEGSNPLILWAATRFPSADFILEEFFLNDAKRNFSRFAGADKDIRQAQGQTDAKMQKQLWREAQIKILEDVAAYPIYAVKNVVARKSYVDLGFKKLEADLCICIPVKWNATLM